MRHIWMYMLGIPAIILIGYTALAIVDSIISSDNIFDFFDYFSCEYIALIEIWAFLLAVLFLISLFAWVVGEK